MNPWTIQHSDGEVQITDGEHCLRWQGSLHGAVRALTMMLILLDAVTADLAENAERLSNVASPRDDFCKEIGGRLKMIMEDIQKLRQEP